LFKMGDHDRDGAYLALLREHERLGAQVALLRAAVARPAFRRQTAGGPFFMAPSTALLLRQQEEELHKLERTLDQWGAGS
jgi:hypothetical protein